MKIRILKTRNFTSMGLKHKGQIVDRPDDEAMQYIEQGFAERYTERTASQRVDEKPASKPVTVKAKEE